MSFVVPLRPIPNQSFPIVLDGNNFRLTFKSLTENMAVTIERNNVTLISGHRVVAGTPLLPYRYLEEGTGNFIFVSDTENIPFYTDFGINQVLIYNTAQELAAIRA